MRITDHEYFKNIGAGVQSLTIAIGVVVGGIWAAYTFGALRSSSIARAELETAEAANRAKHVLSVLIAADSVREDLDGERVLHIRVTLSNQGDTFINLGLPPSNLRVARIRAIAKDSSPPQIDPPVSASVFDLDTTRAYLRVSQGVPPHGERQLHYIVPTKDPGLYMISFESSGSPELDSQASANIGRQSSAGAIIAKRLGIPLRPSAWGATTVVRVR